MNAIKAMRGFESPSALDLLASFSKRYGKVIEIAVKSGEVNPAMLDYFDRELNGLIGAFVNEATKPWQEAFTDALMKTPTPPFVRELYT